MMKLGVVMDPISTINYKKDSTLSMLWEAASRGWDLYYFEQKDLYMREGIAYGSARALKVHHDAAHWYDLGENQEIPLGDLDIMLMRKDPPFDREYIYTTYILEYAEQQGAFVVNKPQALRDANEKLFTLKFPQCCPPTLVTRQLSLLREFYQTHEDIICKPLEAMGGASVFHLRPQDVNATVIFETLTQRESVYMMAQKFIPEIIKGDKRILLIGGEPIPFALARMPAHGEWRGNLAAGANGVAQPLTDKDKWICQQVGPRLREMGLYFVGLDVIGEFLTEINVTSPTCIRELDEQCGLNISKMLLDHVVSRLN